MFECNYPVLDMVNTAIRHIEDCTLEAEIMQYRGYALKLEANTEKQECLKSWSRDCVGTVSKRCGLVTECWTRGCVISTFIGSSEGQGMGGMAWLPSLKRG